MVSARVREPLRKPMETLLVGGIALALFLYLVVAMLCPDKF
jgi:K+-transporting ATPase KdpF subunit